MRNASRDIIRYFSTEDPVDGRIQIIVHLYLQQIICYTIL